MWQDRPRHPYAICARLIDSFLADPDRLLADWAPEGWELSPLRRVVHRARPESVSAEQEVVDLLGLGLWEVFSNNHTVVDEAGVACDLGTWRASGDFIAESLNRRYPHLDYTFDYIDFYMGSEIRGGGADLRPLYRWVFTRLRDAGWQWIYSYPRVYLVDFGHAPTVDDPTSYDPSESVRRELTCGASAEETHSLAEHMERAFGADVARARHAPLPPIVAAYRDVYGELPDGWPHPEM